MTRPRTRSMGRFDGRGHGGAINKRKVSIALTFEDAGAPPSRHVERTVDARGRAPCCIFALTQAQALRRFLGSGPILDALPPRSKPFDRSNVDRQTTRAVGDLQTNSHGRAGACRRLAARITPATGSPRPSSRDLDDRAMRSRSSSSMSSRSPTRHASGRTWQTWLTRTCARKTSSFAGIIRSARLRPLALADVLDDARVEIVLVAEQCPVAWNSVATAALLHFHRCSSEEGVDGAPADAWFSSGREPARTGSRRPYPSSAGAVSRWEGLAKRLAKRSRVAPWTPALSRSSLSSSQSSSS